MYLAHSCKKKLQSDSLINVVTVGLIARIATDKDGDGGYLTRVWNWQSRTEQGITGIVHTFLFKASLITSYTRASSRPILSVRKTQ